jgi:hypothetical protein
MGMLHLKGKWMSSSSSAHMNHCAVLARNRTADRRTLPRWRKPAALLQRVAKVWPHRASQRRRKMFADSVPVGAPFLNSEKCGATVIRCGESVRWRRRRKTNSRTTTPSRGSAKRLAAPAQTLHLEGRPRVPAQGQVVHRGKDDDDEKEKHSDDDSGEEDAPENVDELKQVSACLYRVIGCLRVRPRTFSIGS